MGFGVVFTERPTLLGARRRRRFGDGRPQRTALAVSTSLSPSFSIAVEGYVFSDAAPIAARDGGIRVALGMTPRPWLVFRTSS